jgi:hypothetical protein
MVLNPYDRGIFRDRLNALALDRNSKSLTWAWVQPPYSSFKEIALHNAAPLFFKMDEVNKLMTLAMIPGL